jgi:hypothetical protein
MHDGRNTSRPPDESGGRYRLWTGAPLPNSEDLRVLDGAEFAIIKAWEPAADGCRWLHGVALAWHKGKLYASFGVNSGPENTAGEEARGRVSSDGGRTWGRPFTIARPHEEGLGISHGVLLSNGGTLWAFAGAFSGARRNVHTRAYVLDEAAEQWRGKGTVVGNGFWPMHQPLRMPDGNWVMAGIRLLDDWDRPGNCAAVAISRGDDFARWNLVVIPSDAPGTAWGESAVFIEGSRLVNVSRYGEAHVALAARSDDLGRTWTPSRPTNLPMAASKPCAGTLSTGRHYLICTTAADSGRRRSPLTIALTRAGETTFSQVYVIRHAEHPRGAVESAASASLSYPCAVEHDAKLYVGYSNNGGRGDNHNSAELAIIPVASLGTPAV